MEGRVGTAFLLIVVKENVPGAIVLLNKVKTDFQRHSAVHICANNTHIL